MNGVPVQSAPPVPPNAYTPANPADVQPFLPLAKRYGCFTQQYQVTRSHRPYDPARYEFAAALNYCAETMYALVSAGTVVNQADLLTLRRLEASYSGELAVLRFQFPQVLNARLKALELKPPASHTFSPTITLHVETVLELSGTAGNR